MKGIVYLVGAGCGEADLITVRGMELLTHCDAVVYDDLIDASLPELAPPGAEKIYMGKRRGSHSAPQEEINRTLIELARKGLKVVRLKGGDPLVFGRGGEEMLALREAGIEAVIVPGISSCIAIPAEAGIPVTHRGVSRSFHVVTAHTGGPDGGLPEDLDHLASAGGTIVILMGLRKLPEITAKLISAGMDPMTPAAVISGKNTGHPASLRAPLKEIAVRTETAGIKAPAVIVIGRTAAMDLYGNGDSPDSGASGQQDGAGDIHREQLPLSGITVALTGTDSIRSKLKAALNALGAKVYPAERSVVTELDIPAEHLDRLCDGSPHWVVFTSENGVRIFFRKYLEAGRDYRALAACRFAVIGKATGAALSESGFHPDLCPAHYTGTALAEALLRDGQGISDVFLFRSAIGNKEVAQNLSRKYTVYDVPVYEIHPEAELTEKIRRQLEDTDYLTFASGSGVEAFFGLYQQVPERVRCVCIGETTAAALKRRYQGEFLISSGISAEGLVEAILQDCRR